jgi:hypothetical protein
MQKPADTADVISFVKQRTAVDSCCKQLLVNLFDPVPPQVDDPKQEGERR